MSVRKGVGEDARLQVLAAEADEDQRCAALVAAEAALFYAANSPARLAMELRAVNRVLREREDDERRFRALVAQIDESVEKDEA